MRNFSSPLHLSNSPIISRKILPSQPYFPQLSAGIYPRHLLPSEYHKFLHKDTRENFRKTRAIPKFPGMEFTGKVFSICET